MVALDLRQQITAGDTKKSMTDTVVLGLRYFSPSDSLYGFITGYGLLEAQRLPLASIPAATGDSLHSGMPHRGHGLPTCDPPFGVGFLDLERV